MASGRTTLKVRSEPLCSTLNETSVTSETWKSGLEVQTSVRCPDDVRPSLLRWLWSPLAPGGRKLKSLKEIKKLQQEIYSSWKLWPTHWSTERRNKRSHVRGNSWFIFTKSSELAKISLVQHKVTSTQNAKLGKNIKTTVVEHTQRQRIKVQNIISNNERDSEKFGMRARGYFSRMNAMKRKSPRDLGFD